MTASQLVLFKAKNTLFLRIYVYHYGTKFQRNYLASVLATKSCSRGLLFAAYCARGHGVVNITVKYGLHFGIFLPLGYDNIRIRIDCNRFVSAVFVR